MQKDIEGAEELMRGADVEMRELATEELATLVQKRDALLAELRVLLVPKDPNDEKNVILEIRAGTGGEEAALFAGDLFRMHSRFAERQGWKLEVMSTSDSATGGLKKSSRQLTDGGSTVASSMKAAYTAFSVCRLQKRAAGFHLHGDGGGISGGRGSRHSNQREGPADRHVLLQRTGRAKRQHHLFGCPHHAYSDRHGCVTAGREIADQKPRESDEGAARASMKWRCVSSRKRSRRATRSGRCRANAPKDSNLQLSPKPHHGSPDQLHHPSAARGARRRPGEILDQVISFYTAEKLKEATAVN